MTTCVRRVVSSCTRARSRSRWAGDSRRWNCSTRCACFTADNRSSERHAAYITSLYGTMTTRSCSQNTSRPLYNSNPPTAVFACSSTHARRRRASSRPRTRRRVGFGAEDHTFTLDHGIDLDPGRRPPVHDPGTFRTGVVPSEEVGEDAVLEVHSPRRTVAEAQPHCHVVPVELGPLAACHGTMTMTTRTAAAAWRNRAVVGRGRTAESRLMGSARRLCGMSGFGRGSSSIASWIIATQRRAQRGTRSSTLPESRSSARRCTMPCAMRAGGRTGGDPIASRPSIALR